MCLFSGDVVNRHLVLMCCTVRRSGTDRGERARCQVVDACPGRVHIRQARRACSHHSHRHRTALSRYVSECSLAFCQSSQHVRLKSS